MKKKMSIVSLIIFIFSIIPFEYVYASNNINIISDTYISVIDAEEWAEKKGATKEFISLAKLYWKYYKENGGVNPAIAYIQSAKETGYGNFGGVIDASFKNPCGLKTTVGGDDKDPNAHMKFNSWEEGVQAHLDHLALYAGVSGYPRETTYDPRHFGFLFGKAETVIALGGAWAPSKSYGEDLFRMYNELIEYSNSKKLIMITIDTPENGKLITSNNVTVRGWALHPSGIKEVKVYVDGVYKKNATIGGSRPDVNNAYPGYPGGSNSGYNAEIDLASVSEGKKNIKVEVIGNDGSKKSTERIIEIVKKETKIAIDAPVSGEKVTSNNVTVRGWALHPSGIKEVKVYVDGVYKKNATIGGSRPDVNNAYPGYPGGSNSGYNAEIDLASVSEGKKNIKVEVIGNDGSKKSTERIIEIVKKETKIAIDAPVSGEKVTSNNVTVRGWALHPSGIKEVKVYVDGVYKKNATIGGSRPDVNNAYPGYPGGSNSGYNAEIDLASVSEGKKNIKVEVIGNDGSKKSTERIIEIVKKETKIAIDAPVSGEKVTSNNVTVRGWALHPSGVKEVKVYVDGVYKKNATIGGSRPDVNNAYPGYPGGSNSGYNAEIDLASVAVGKKNIKVEVVGNDLSIKSIERNINIYSKTIVIDPGHNIKAIGGIDGGAKYTHNGILYNEEVLNMQLALKVKDELEKIGHNVLLTQDSNYVANDKNVTESLERRVNFANNNNASLMVSIHHNSYPLPSVNGIEVFYSSDMKLANNEISTKSKILATDLAKEISVNGGFYNRGAKDNNLYVTRNAKMPSVLVEAGFISNPTEAVKVANQQNQLKVAKAIANSINKFMEN